MRGTMTADPEDPSPQLPEHEAGKRKGVFNARRVRFVSFVVIALSLFATAVLCVLAIWDYACHDTAWRALSTLGVIAGTMLIFAFINEALGAKIDI